MSDRGIPRVAKMVEYCCGLLRSELGSMESCCGLVLGCGDGTEVVYMRRAFGSARVVGVDVKARFSAWAVADKCVLVADAQTLPFRSGVFDFAAAFHSLEHVEDPRRALKEFRRVLRPDAWLYIGVPNRSRLLGYVGSFDATTWQKITWNLTDWWARLRGRFRNEAGAHAGFDRKELALMLQERFSEVRFLTEPFIRFKYAGRLPEFLLDLLLASSVINYTAPSHYALCRTEGRAST